MGQIQTSIFFFFCRKKMVWWIKFWLTARESWKRASSNYPRKATTWDVIIRILSLFVCRDFSDSWQMMTGWTSPSRVIDGKFIETTRRPCLFRRFENSIITWLCVTSWRRCPQKGHWLRKCKIAAIDSSMPCPTLIFIEMNIEFRFCRVCLERV